MSKAPVYWVGQPDTKCDTCPRSFTNEFVDGRTIGGSWANMCPSCFPRLGIGLGLGRGQRYRRQPDGRWLKVEG